MKKGITLISLVITIIILLILATVAINIAIDANGIFGRARYAAESWNKSLEDEKTHTENIFAIVNELNLGGVIEADPTPKTQDTTPDSIAKKEDGSYLIQSIEDLVILSKSVNKEEGYTGNTYEGTKFTLEIDLDFKSRNSYIDADSERFGDINGNDTVEPLMTELTTGKGFTPIGTYQNRFKNNVIEGQEHSISNLYINGYTYEGLIGCGESLTINNLKMLNVDLKSNDYAGSFVGYMLNNSLTTVDLECSGIISGGTAGGIIGAIYAYESKDSESTLTINKWSNFASISGNWNIGGLVGKISYVKDIKIQDSKNKGKVIGSGKTGGLIAVLEGDSSNKNSSNAEIANCSNEADIGFEYGSNNSGGLVASVNYKNKVTISNCYNTGTIRSKSSYTAGLIGEFYSVNEQTIANSYNTGDVLASSSYVGGIVGRSNKNLDMTACYNSGNVKGTGKLGGLVGTCENLEKMKIENCYNRGNINYSDGSVGGILGYTSSESFTIYSCYNAGNLYDGSKQKDKTSVGGIFGGGPYGEFASNYGIHNCFNIGIMNSEGSYNVGSICGGQNMSLSDNYYLKGTGVQNAYNDTVGNANEIGTLDAMKSKMKEILTGTTWKEGSDGFPILSYQNEIAN